ncbi:MAG: hypothetical protein GC150_05740 [Rhizobiales bacterium]|nr:hypothetical protein [Hyphomicrobiales bacterium]
MAMSADRAATERDSTGHLYAIVAFALLAGGLAGIIGDAVGYGLFLIATLILLAAVVMMGLYFMTRAFDGPSLREAYTNAFQAGGWCYVFAVSALAGHYTHEAILGRLDWHWIVFGPAILAAIVYLDVNLYRIIYKRNEPTLQRYGHVMERRNLQPEAMRATFIEEVVVHKSLFKVSPFRWVRHQLILWGFGLMFAVEIVAVVFREAWPAFGFADVWRTPGHPLRAAFDFAYDLTGLMVLIGCILALIFRVMVNGKPEQKFTDTPTALFLFVVVLTGFVLEGVRINSEMAIYSQAEFVGEAFAVGLAAIGLGSLSAGAHSALWYFHVLLSCAFIAYVPVWRLIHSCATPLGRMVNSQKTMLAMKKQTALRGLMQGQARGAIMTPSTTDFPKAPGRD